MSKLFRKCKFGSSNAPMEKASSKQYDGESNGKPREVRSKAHWMPIIDHCSKVIVGHALGESANTELALDAWEKAKFMLRRFCQKIEDIIIHHDQDGVYIGYRWLYQVAVKDKVRISYSEDGAKGNVYSESFIGRFKSENRLLSWEQDDFEALEEVIQVRVRYFNRVRRHSTLGNKSPLEYINGKTNTIIGMDC
jgi:putative transposase